MSDVERGVPIPASQEFQEAIKKLKDMTVFGFILQPELLRQDEEFFFKKYAALLSKYGIFDKKNNKPILDCADELDKFMGEANRQLEQTKGEENRYIFYEAMYNHAKGIRENLFRYRDPGVLDRVSSDITKFSELTKTI